MNLSELEQKFRQTLKQAHQEIYDCLAKAEEELDKAEAISEKYGIPFSSSISPLGQDYCPTTFNEIWNPYNDETIDEEFDERNELMDKILYEGDMYGIPEEEGWQHSAIC